MNRNTPGLPVHHQLPASTQTHIHWFRDAIQPSHPLSPLSLRPPISPSIRVFSNESTLRMRWPKYWSFSFSIVPSKEHPGLIPFRMDWLDLLAVQGTLKSLLQHYSSKASSLWHSAFFTAQLSHPCHSVLSNFLELHVLCGLWNSPGQNTGVGSLSLLQGIFPTQGSNTGLLHCRRILY